MIRRLRLVAALVIWAATAWVAWRGWRRRRRARGVYTGVDRESGLALRIALRPHEIRQAQARERSALLLG